MAAGGRVIAVAPDWHPTPLGEGRLRWLFDKAMLLERCPSLQDGIPLRDLNSAKHYAFDFASLLLEGINIKKSV